MKPSADDASARLILISCFPPLGNNDFLMIPPRKTTKMGSTSQGVDLLETEGDESTSKRRGEKWWDEIANRLCRKGEDTVGRVAPLWPTMGRR